MPKSLCIDWNSPLIESLVNKLLSDSSPELCDLSTTTLLVPTVQSGRRLREALAHAKKDSGLLPPSIYTPDQWLAALLPKTGIADPNTALATWALVLQTIELTRFPSVFPQKPNRSTAWLLSMAERLMQLRSELGEAGLDFADTAVKVRDTPFETARWQDLAQLESAYLEVLQSQSLQDPLRARRVAADNPTIEPTCQRICLVATPDPQPLPLRALQNIESKLQVEIWIYGSEETETLFDQWGRPQTETWQNRPLDLEAWNCQLTTLANPLDTANRIAKSADGKAVESIAIGLADPELTAITADALLSAKIAFYDPNGEPLNQSSLARLTELIADLSTQSPANHVRSLLQQPEVWRSLSKDLSAQATQKQALQQLDALTENHLATNFRNLAYFAKQSTHSATIDQCLKALQHWIDRRKSADSFATGLSQILQVIFTRGHQTADTPNWKEHAEEIRNCLEKSQSSTLHQSLAPDFTPLAFKNQLKASRTYPDRPRNAHDLLGWLELLWTDAPHLILAGMNEGSVPESITSDAFLPESLREHLGLRNNTQRFARDAYLLEALCRRRSKTGRIEILIPKTAADQTPLKPSRLLFQGASDTLIPRTKALFTETSSYKPSTPHSYPWQLTPPKKLPLPTSLSVSSLKDYLQCPFRFFLKHILKMRPIHPDARELSPAMFGTLLHDSLSKLESRMLDDSISPQELQSEIERQINQDVATNYGKQLSFALRLQLEALYSRAQAFAHVQLEDLQPDCSIRILNTEGRFEIPFKNCTIRGTIDRIDQRADQIELIDYKTADTPKTPREAHLKVVARKEPPAHLPPEAFFEHEGKTYYWTDLQLPLYIQSQAKPGEPLPKVAYFNLAKTLEKSAIARWHDFTPSHLDSAINCAQAIIDRIQTGIFWPPNNELREEYDDFAPYFPDGIEKSVDKIAFANYRFESTIQNTVK
jgi:ATP-dependent helicase/nuclease subunit B